MNPIKSLDELRDFYLLSGWGKKSFFFFFFFPMNMFVIKKRPFRKLFISEDNDYKGKSQLGAIR